MVRQRVRIRFAKQGDLRLLGHRDLVRLLERLFRRAGLRLGLSEGFHPKPRMSFPSALALGIEGIDEVMELELADPGAAEALRERLAAHAVPGLSFSAVELLAPGTKKAQVQSTTYELPIPVQRSAAAADQIRRLCGQCASASAQASEADAPEAGAPDVRRTLEELRLEEGRLRFRLRASRQRSAGPRDVLAALGLDDLEPQGAWLTRLQVQLQP